MKRLGLGPMLAALTVTSVFLSGQAAAQVDVVAVTGGRVEGVRAHGVTVFKGIPFAAPPVGRLRWRAPAPVRPWRGIRKAEHFAPGCMQAANLVPTFGEHAAMSENCLYLNVWTPAKSPRERLPVMVWIYGGSFLGGMTSQPVYDGTHLAQQGVVVVSLAYRVGVFGFLAAPALSAESAHHASGNYGLLDMMAGLRWVKRNIGRFGGDPTRVTVFGESAGAMAVGMLAQSPLAKGLFERAIAESGANFPYFAARGPLPLARAQRVGTRFLGRLGARTLAEGRALRAQVLQQALGLAEPTSPILFRPVRDGYVLRGSAISLYRAHSFNDTPVLIGTNSGEGSLFVPAHTTPKQFEAQVRAQFGSHAGSILAVYPHASAAAASRSAADLWRDTVMAWPAWTWARLQSEYGRGKAYLYYFDVHESQYPAHGAPHGSEIGYVFDNVGNLIHSGAAVTWPAPADSAALARRISRYWRNFARTGDPNGAGLPHWPAFDVRSERVMVFDAHPEARLLPNRRKLEALDAYYKWRRRAHTSP